MTRAASRLILLAAAVAVSSCDAPAGTDWLLDPVWEDGLAEVCLYEGTRTVYGAPRASSLELITVREHFDPARKVKTAPAPGKTVLPVLKTLMTLRTRTGIYEYFQQASVFVDRRDGRLVKLTAVHAEWCGNSAARVIDEGDDYLVTLDRYFDDTGFEQRTVPAAGRPVLQEELFVLVRRDLDELEPGWRFAWQPSLLGARPEWAPRPARVVAVTDETARRDGASVPARRVTLMTGDARQEFLVARTPRRTILMWRGPDGATYRLRKRMVIDYWNRNRPGDEALLE